MGIYLLFIIFMAFCIFLDLAVINKNTHDHKKAQGRATIATLVWTAVGLLFSIFIYYGYNFHWMGLGDTVGLPSSGWTAMIHYITGYLVELSLSIDNVFVMILLFKYFKIPFYNQHKALIYGILGAIFFRGLLIYLGYYLLNQLPWFNYVFGAILIFSAIRLYRQNPEEQDISKNQIIRYLRKVLPVIKDPNNPHFITKVRGIVVITPLFLSLIMIELSDIMFAFDSIPAIFGITRDPFIVFSSNIFAILGLRSLYLILNTYLGRYENIKYSLVFILLFIGIKIGVEHFLEISAAVSLPVIVVSLFLGIITSPKQDSSEVR